MRISRAGGGLFFLRGGIGGLLSENAGALVHLVAADDYRLVVVVKRLLAEGAVAHRVLLSY
jgi:hypothetical protein